MLERYFYLKSYGFKTHFEKVFWSAVNLMGMSSLKGVGTLNLNVKISFPLGPDELKSQCQRPKIRTFS